MIACALLATLAGATPAPSMPARAALVVGARAGVTGRPPLLYAERDADRMAELLLELGGFQANRVKVLHGPGLGELRSAFADLARTLPSASSDSLFLFYFSGHGSKEELELGDEVLGAAELAFMLTGTHARVALAFIDACEFRFPQQANRKGVHPAATELVGLASSAAGGASQESIAWGGSFFTLRLLEGLRGLADSNGDGRISLEEESVYVGAKQPPAGSLGHLVALSELARARARVVLPGGAELLVTDGARKEIWAAPSGRLPATLALPPGSWRVERLGPDPIHGLRFQLQPGERRVLSVSELDACVAVQGIEANGDR